LDCNNGLVFFNMIQWPYGQENKFLAIFMYWGVNMKTVCQQLIEDIRQNFFDWKIEQAVQDSIKLLETIVADPEVDQDAVERVAATILSAMEHKDYLLVADLIYFEIPNTWENK